jgi:hypothetical protein
MDFALFLSPRPSNRKPNSQTHAAKIDCFSGAKCYATRDFAGLEGSVRLRIYEFMNRHKLRQILAAGSRQSAVSMGMMQFE